MQEKKRSGLVLMATVAAAAAMAYWMLGLDRYLQLDTLQRSHGTLLALYQRQPLGVAAGYVLVYVLVAALSIPGAVVLTLAAGAIFGLGWGVLLVSFASSAGATLAFLAARYVLRDRIAARLGPRLTEINRGLAADGAWYLLALRLVPAVPFVVINVVMGLTQLPTRVFYAVSQVGMLAGTVVFVNAGTQLAQVRSVQGIVSPGVLGALVLLGVFPLLARGLLAGVRRRRVYARWAGVRPSRFDRNLVVIGAGAGGLVSAYIAAAVKARVTLVESHKMGGDCLNTGCVPSKALIRSARLAHQMRHADRYGLYSENDMLEKRWSSFSFANVMQRIRTIVAAVAPHDSVERYTALGVDVVQGHARILNPWTVEIALNAGGTQVLTTRNIVIAAGAHPIVPPLPGLDEVGYVTSDTLWDTFAALDAPPRRLVVLGGGPMGCELAQSFARLGAGVIQVEAAPRLLMREDPDVSAVIARSLQADGVQVLTGHRALRCERTPANERVLVVAHDGGETRLVFDQLLCAVGRQARLSGYGLEALDIPTQHTVGVNAYLQTLYPNIYAVGDVAGPHQFTHTAAHQAWYAVVNALFGDVRRFKVDYRVIPVVTFTDPEVARVGLNEQEALAQGIAFEVTQFGLDELDRAIADSQTQGFIKVLTPPGQDRLLGVTIVGAHAGEWLTEYVLAMKHGLGLNHILSTPHAYPTLAEANKYAAGAWKRAHQPHRLLSWARRYHDWMRG
jgi:pyruvate/2-oxoglutarate dehydrogenase complex dihydrolipoamide dehydrogenase (E3) component/uncharacterized membrane protein YdjX (TVP38/TMEM64 family)